MRTQVAVAVTLLYYAWASQVFQVFRPGRQPLSSSSQTRFRHHSMLAHVEGTEATDTWNWLMRSGVCRLGRVAWGLWCVALTALTLLPRPAPLRVRLLLHVALGVTIVLTFLMNLPLAVRATPAFLAMGVLIHQHA